MALKCVISVFLSALVICGADDASEIQELRSQVADEQRRSRIADVATQALLANASKQKLARQRAEAELAKADAQSRKIQDAAENATRTVKALQAQLLEANKRVARAEAARSAIETGMEATKNATELNRSRDDHQAVTFDGFAVFVGVIRTWPNQNLEALAAGLIGLLSFVDPRVFLVSLSVGTLAIAVGFTVTVESRESWAADIPDWLNYVVFLETAGVIGLAAWVGFQGFQMVIGGLLGISLSRFCSNCGLIAAWDTTEGILWYAILAALGAILMVKGNQKALAMVGPVVGGLLVASSCRFFLDAFSSTGVTCPWLDGMSSLTSSVDPNNACVGGEAGAHRISLAVWVIVAIIGNTRWFFDQPRLPCEKSGKRSSRSSSAGMQTPLLDTGDGGSRKERRPSRERETIGLPPPPKPPKKNSSHR